MDEPLPEVPPLRCKQCDHLMSFHSDDGCGTWLLGVRAVPLYRCACVHSKSSTPIKFNPPPPKGFDSSNPHGFSRAPLHPAFSSTSAQSANLTNAFIASGGKDLTQASQLSGNVQEQVNILRDRLTMLQTLPAKNQDFDKELLDALRSIVLLVNIVIQRRSNDAS